MRDEAAADPRRSGLLIPTEVPGVYGLSADFERLRSAVDGLIGRWALSEGAERVSFPPLVPRAHLELTGYTASFPHLVGAVAGLDGETDLALAPAACYPVYPAVAARGPLPESGLVIDTGAAYAFRREPSDDPYRLQMFHLRELVRFGREPEVDAWRERWCSRAVELLGALGLGVDAAVASDPFFGREGRLLAESQRQQELKHEVRVASNGGRTAIASTNYHRDHFASAFGLRMHDDEPVHTACVGFGEERIALALFDAHGPDVGGWPVDVRSGLWPDLA